MKKQFPLLDLGKIVSALLIVYIHVPFFLSINEILNYWVMLIARVAVPFFFVVSSFLYFEEYDTYETGILFSKKWVSNLLEIWIRWSGLYLIIRMIECFFYNYNFIWTLKLIIRDFVFDGISGHLWYIPALMFSVVFVGFLLKHFRERCVWIITIVLFIFGIVGNTYIVFMPEDIVELINKLLYCIKYTRNGLFWSPILVFSGYILHKKYNKLVKIKDKKYINFIIVLTCFLFMEGKIVSTVSKNYSTYSQDMWIFCIPLATTIVAFLLKKSINFRRNYKYLRVMSQYIYFIHPAYIYILQIVLYNKISITQKSWLYYIVVVSLTLLTSSLLTKNKIVKNRETIKDVQNGRK